MNEVEVKEFLKTAVFYPCYAFDGTPVKILAKRLTKFFYVCGGNTHARVEEECRRYPFDGYHCDLIETEDGRLFFGGEHGVGGGVVRTIWRRDTDRPEEHGVEQFEVLFANCEGIRAFQAAYSRLNIAPYCLAYLPVCVLHGYEVPPFEQALRENPGGLPRYVLYDKRQQPDGRYNVEYMQLFEEYTPIERPDHRPGRNYEPNIFLAQLTAWRGDDLDINFEGANEHPAPNRVPNIGCPPWCGTEARRCQETDHWREKCQQLVDPTTSAEVRTQLVNQGSSVVPPLIRILEDINNRPTILKKVAWILGEIHDPRARKPLQEKERHDLDPSVRHEATEALHKLPPVLTITKATLPDATRRLEYTATLQATGGTPPYQWLRVPRSRLPAWLTLENNGVLSGIPTRKVQPSSFTVQVTDANHQIATQTLSLIVN